MVVVPFMDSWYCSGILALQKQINAKISLVKALYGIK
jgi:hypothetical protein